MIGRWIAAIGLGLVGAAGIGALAGSFTPDDFAVKAAIFGAAALGPATFSAWYVLIGRKEVAKDARQHTDSVEQQWAGRAASGAFTDLMIVLGVSLTAVSISGWEPPVGLVLLALTILGLGDMAVRYLLAERRER